MSQYDEYIVGEKSVYCKGVLCVVGLICGFLAVTVVGYQTGTEFIAIVGLAAVMIICMCMQVRETQLEAKKRAESESVEND